MSFTSMYQPLPQLECRLFKAANIPRDKTDVSECKDYIFGMLRLRRCADARKPGRERLMSCLADTDSRLVAERDRTTAERLIERGLMDEHLLTSSFCITPLLGTVPEGNS